MNQHDVLAYAFASTAVLEIRAGEEPWDKVFSGDVYVTSSRTWPVPDFVLVDNATHVTAAAEFKPPDQTKREYLTGFGQAVAYSRDFDFGLLIIPSRADDNYRIADHVVDVLNQDEFTHLPVGVLSYDPTKISSEHIEYDFDRPVAPREKHPAAPAALGTSFYAKWREVSPMELAHFIRYLYDEGVNPTSSDRTIRDRAFDRLWKTLQTGGLEHWGGAVRNASDTAKNKVAWSKNYRNFVNHIGWAEADGALTADGLTALHKAHIYGGQSMLFLDVLTGSLLTEGKHLVLINSINEHQDDYIEENGPFDSEATWLSTIEDYLEERGMLKRNPERAKAAVKKSRRQFLKAEKQLWRNLGLLIPHGAKGGRVYHPGRGFIFNWSRITELLKG